MNRGIQAKDMIARKWPWGALFGFGAFVVYVTFTLLAITQFPGKVTPIDTYLSMLGNADINPSGAIFYNLGVILGGMVVILFYVAIFQYYSPYGHKWLVKIGCLTGILNGIAVLMSGVYAEHINMEAHISWSYLIFFTFIPVLLVFNLVLWRIAKGTSLYGFIVCAVDIFFLATILSGGLDPGLGSIMEWASVFAYLAWVGLVSLDVLKGSRSEKER
jgi:hypothetical protein